MKKLKICIAGLGNVGSSVVNLIEKNSSYVETKSHLNQIIIILIINIVISNCKLDFF